MAFFQNSVLNKHLKVQDKEVVNAAYQRFSAYFHNHEIQQNIRDSKEEQFQEGFLRELFVNVLGYTLNPQPNFNLTTELKNEKGAKKADGAILQNRKALGVIELKGTDTKDLDRINIQAFNYKNNQAGCVYVITSNFEKLRFFIHHSVEHLEFNLFTLSETEFQLLWLCLHADNLLSGVPLKVKEESLLEEEKITKQLYKDYAAFRNDMWQNMVKNSHAKDKLLLFKKTQKLLDRYLFIFFAEDSGLLPPNSISRIIARWELLKQEDSYKPLYEIFKQYFGYIDTGRKGLKTVDDIFAYNGGLFQPDEVLDNIVLDDEMLYPHVMKLTHYDFQSEIDVNILGHIFENSLNEIENITAQLEGQEIDKSKSKRKKDGVFYTPKYITKYIVDNTVGKLCNEKKTELDIIDEEYAKGRRNRKKDTIKKLNENLQTYRNWLLNITICDPACGSGAFLNQALEFLMAEHAYVDELQAQLFGASIVLQDVNNHILEKNIFGVDINEESVDIAKLSLWLRTAQKGRKLTTLNNNIKCGNSLIDDPAVAGEKAFNWQKEFPIVFEKGGFDVVIGNPPYVGEKGHSEIFETLKAIPKWNEYYRRRSNLYYFFIKLGTELIKENGLQSLIIPREFVSADWSNKVRYEILSKTSIITIVDFNDLKVFDDAGTTSLILTQRRNVSVNDYQIKFISLRNQNLISSELFDMLKISNYESKKLDKSGLKPWNFYQDDFKALNSEFSISKYFSISQGLVTGADRVTNKHLVNNIIDKKLLGRGIFVLSKDIDIKIDNLTYQLLIKEQWVTLSNEEKKFIKPFIKTENLNKWYVTEPDTFIIYTSSSELKGNIKEYLLQFADILLNRATIIPEGEVIRLSDFENYTIEDIKSKYSSAGAVQKIMRRKQWWIPLYERADVPFEKAKIMVNTKNMDKFTYSDGAHYSSGGGAGGQNYIYLNTGGEKEIIPFTTTNDFLKFTNAVLNSKFIQKYIMDGQFNQLSTSKIGDIPFLSLDEIKTNINFYNTIVEKTEVLIDTTIRLDELIINLDLFLKSKLSIIVGKMILNNSFDFVDYLVRYKVKLTVSEEAEWMQYFNEQKQKAQALKAEINRVDEEIDKMVYQLYELTDEEIKIVEGK